MFLTLAHNKSNLLKKITLFLKLLPLLFLTEITFATYAKAQEEALTFLRIGTGPPEGTYFPVGGMLANIISQSSVKYPCKPFESCDHARVIAVAQSSDGSLENVSSIKSGLFDSALCQGDVAYQAYHGKNDMEVNELRAIANLYPETVHIVVHGHSKIYNFKDLKGKKVAVGPKKSGSYVISKNLLDVYGLTEKDIDLIYAAPGQASDLLREQEIDAFIQIAGAPVTSISELAQSYHIRLIPIGIDKVEKLKKEFPYFSYRIIPEGTYKDVDRTPVVAVGAQWLVNKEVPEEVVYNLTKALWQETNLTLLRASHPKGKYITLESALEGVAIPLHKGAERFYKENIPAKVDLFSAKKYNIE